MKLPKSKYTEGEFKIADRLGKMYMRMVQPLDFSLNDRDEMYFQKMRWVYPLLCEGRPRRHIIAQIQTVDAGMWRNQAEGLIEDTQRLFGNFSKVNKNLLRGIHREKMLHFASILEDEFLTKISGTDIEDNEIQVFKNGSEAIIPAIEQIRKLWKDIATNENLDKIDEKTDDGEEFPDFDFEEKYIQNTTYEDVEKTEGAIHLETLPVSSQGLE